MTFEQLEQELSKSRARVIELRIERDDTKQEHERLQGIYTGAIERIQYLEEQLAQIREHLGIIRLVDVSVLPTFAGEVADMVIAGNAAQKELKQVKASRRDLETALEKEQKYVQSLQTENAAGRESEDEAHAHVEDLKHAAEKADRKATKWEKRVRELEATLEQVKASRLDLENALSNAEGLHARCEEEKKHLEAKYQALVKEAAIRQALVDAFVTITEVLNDEPA